MAEIPVLDSLQVTPELFVIPYDSRYIIYAPLKGIALFANRTLVSTLARLKKCSLADAALDVSLIHDLFTWGLLELKGQPSSFPPPSLSEAFAPTDLAILTTAFCNFRCKYCYASAGERQQQFDPRVARAAVRFVVENALAQDKEECNIAFHGGGEPTLAFSLITEDAMQSSLPRKCWRCNGSGKVIAPRPYGLRSIGGFYTEDPYGDYLKICPICDGVGYLFPERRKVCQVCSGSGVIQIEHKFLRIFRLRRSVNCPACQGRGFMTLPSDRTKV